jgi:Ca2+-binding EF-hand superfamily protein
MQARAIMMIAALGLSAAVMAEEMPKFETVDTNKDGMISQEEAKKVEGLNFAAIDVNHDGAIDRDEYAKAVS